MSETASAPQELAAPAPVVLDVRGLVRSFGAIRAVDNASFQVHAGSIFGFVGPNGAGKTTTLRILATLEVASHGDALVDGVSVVDHPRRVRPLVGFMPDRSAVYEGLTVREYLDFFARSYGLHGATRRGRVDGVIEFARLGTLADRFVSTLSKGMKQRVVLGRTLLNDPKLLLLDEPADGLDPRARIELRELLRALADQGKAVLVSSHILTELSEMCDSCAIIERGRLLASGSIADILAGRGTLADVRIRLLDAAAAAACARWLLEQPGLSDVRPAGAQVRVRFAGREEQAAALLRSLVGAGHAVVSFELREGNLEDAFMSVTKGDVQ